MCFSFNRAIKENASVLGLFHLKIKGRVGQQNIKLRRGGGTMKITNIHHMAQTDRGYSQIVSKMAFTDEKL